MARATADGSKIRVECEAGTFYVQPHEARALTAQLAAATDDLFDEGYSAAAGAHSRAIAEHQAWRKKVEAELKGDGEC